MYKGKKLSLVLPAYNEEDAIKKTIDDFYDLKIFDEIIVVDNNSRDNTTKIAKETKKVKIVKETRQGYGYALRRGYAEAKGDIIAACDVDGTYIASDIKKHLKLIDKYDFVFGTRVHSNLDWIQSYHMNIMRRWANRSIATFMSFIFGGPKFTDLGCTFRVFQKEAYKKFEGKFHVGGGHFQPEFTMLALLHGGKIAEVPVHYQDRIGESKLSGTFKSGFRLARKMLYLIVNYRVQSILGKLPVISNDRP